MRGTCPIPFTALRLAAVLKLVSAQIPKLRVSFSLASCYSPRQGQYVLLGTYNLRYFVTYIK